MILFLLENRASSLGKTRKWEMRVCFFTVTSPNASGSVKDGATSSHLKGILVSKRNSDTLGNKEFSPKENMMN